MTRVEVAGMGKKINCNNSRRLGLLGGISATKMINDDRLLLIGYYQLAMKGSIVSGI